MKMNKRKVAVLALIACLLSILSLGSLAWFSADDTITNNLVFDTAFSVEVFETDEDGEEVKEQNDYSDILPGDKISKDPTVRNTSTNIDQYIRMTVTLDNYSTWAKYVEEGSDLTSIFGGFNDSAWERKDDPVIDNDTISYTFYLLNKLEPGATATLFESVTIPTGLTLEDAKETTITVTAQAIQEKNTGAESCYDAFQKVFDEE